MRAITEPSREPKGWELSLNALCADDTARTVRFLTGAVMACGGFVLSRRFDAGETAAIEFEFVDSEIYLMRFFSISDKMDDHIGPT